jgi:uncharacterized protein (DUF58 family)
MSVERAYVSLDALIQTRFNARGLDVRRRSHAVSQLAGSQRSVFRGRGLDFDEVRIYQAGDDIRAIDWRVTARSGQPHTKLFREERERPTLIAVDQRRGMFFGSQRCKSVLACRLAASLAWAALAANDRVGGLVFGDQQHRDVRPRRSRQSVLQLLEQLHHHNHLLQHPGPSAGGLARALTELRRIARPGSSVFVLSDFSGDDWPACEQQLGLLARHCDITAILISDPLERELPRPGQYLVSDGRQRALLDSHGAARRARYRAQFETHCDHLQSRLAGFRIPLLLAGTDDDEAPWLARYFGARR